jgi:hypothetical protein
VNFGDILHSLQVVDIIIHLVDTTIMSIIVLVHSTQGVEKLLVLLSMVVVLPVVWVVLGVAEAVVPAV